MATSEEFTEACGFVMPLGKYAGKTLARIGSNREGLLYLDWMIGCDWVRGPLVRHLTVYLNHPVVKRELKSYIEE